MKRVSVITINYNDKEGLEKTILSVINQTAFKDIEYIIIDGGSSDGSAEIINQYSEKISYWVSEKDSGIYNAMNKGTRAATCDYCLYLNSGDCFVNDNVVADFLPQLDGTDIIIGRVDGIRDFVGPLLEHPVTLSFFYRYTFPHQSTFIKKHLVIEHPYDETLKICSDRKFFIQAVILDGVSYRMVDKVIAICDSNGISSSNLALTEHEHQQILSELIPMRILEDYISCNEGQGYENTIYDKFFITLKKSHKGWQSLIYSVDVILLKCLSIFKKNAKFARLFPNKLS